IPVLGARPPVQPGPPTPVVIKENLGMDVARVYIDLMNSTINTFNPAMISHGYLIELQGRNGQVVSERVWKWENGVMSEEIQNPNIAHGLSDGKIEFSVAGTALAGLNTDTKFYFEMTNWIGEKDASEFAYRAGKIQQQNIETNVETRGTSHAPIHINGDSQFTGANGVVSGSGTSADPYIIDGWDIDANGGPYAIWVENTTAYFVVRNCTLYRATSTTSAPTGAGIALNNVTNGCIENNRCNNSNRGIYLYGSSQYNNITNNNASNNQFGIYVYSPSNSNNITNNNAFGNTNQGILLYSSSHNNIANNNASGNTNNGIYIEASSYNNIANNNVSSNKYGIQLSSSNTYNNITNNNAFGNSYSGIYLYSSSNYNNITNNNAFGNTQHGLLLFSSCNYNKITNNNVSSNNQYGIYLYSSQSNILTYNWLRNNANYGVYIASSAIANILHHNNFIGNKGASKGISDGKCQAYDSVSGNTWYNNTIQEGNYWSNWNGQGWGTTNAYPLDGGVGASDWYPLRSAGLHTPIHITNNNEFTAENGVIRGSGTQNDPYIIGDWEIDAKGGTYCIWIENTDVYFVVRNCTVYNATNAGSVPYGAGITLNNMRNGFLENNKCNNSNRGIYLYGSSQYNNITNNNAYGNTQYGIYLYSSSNYNNITNNNASNNNQFGVYLYSSSNYNNITNNTVSGNANHGILLYSSNNNNITSNNASGNTNYDIYLYSSSNNTIANNKATDNSKYGIHLASSSNYNNISNNTVSNNTNYGIYLSASNSNSITYNWICNNTNYGVYITSGSIDNTIHHNNFIGNNGATKGISGNCQAYDNCGGNNWYNNSSKEGNYWSNWNNLGWGTPSAYPIDGGAGASDWYPLHIKRGPIHITNNGEFTPVNGVVGGSGTQADPYLIEGWEIDANGGIYCIWIENTDAYFVIRNCNLYNATDGNSMTNGNAIALNNVQNGTIENCSCNGCRYSGIYLYSNARFNNIRNNYISSIGYYCIILSNANYTNITDNNISASYEGIYMEYSKYNNIIGNYASNFPNTNGIYTYYSDNNAIENNKFYSAKNGIYLRTSSNNTVRGNVVSGCSQYGIYLYSSSTNNTIINNNVSGNPYGIYLSSSSNNNITNNNVSSNSNRGIYLSFSSNNLITYNWICNNTNYGVYITSSSTGNYIYYNYFIGNNGAGKGVSGNCQAYDSVGGNIWYNNTIQEGNYWSNWDGNGWGTAGAYPIDGGAGASDWYPIIETSVFSNLGVLLMVILPILARKTQSEKGRRKP
ncbi:MAG: NosD domain-containing protein, partial [Thermoplasmata archaeon]